MDTKIIFDVKPLHFWKDIILKMMGSAFLLVLAITFFYASIKDNLGFLELLKYIIFIMLIPLNKIVIQSKDEIYSIRITVDNMVLIKWNRWFIKREICIPKAKISAKVEMTSFQRNAFFLKVIYEEGNSLNETRQFSSSNWNVNLMREVVGGI